MGIPFLIVTYETYSKNQTRNEDYFSPVFDCRSCSPTLGLYSPCLWPSTLCKISLCTRSLQCLLSRLLPSICLAIWCQCSSSSQRTCGPSRCQNGTSRQNGRSCQNGRNRRRS